MPYEYAYPRAALTVDAVVFASDETGAQVLLIERARDPFAGCWALPGGFLDMHETLEEAVRRELREETGIVLSSMDTLGVFDAINRDPRERVITVAFTAIVDRAMHVPRADDDARDARWFRLDALPALAFDHAHVVACARQKLHL